MASVAEPVRRPGNGNALEARSNKLSELARFVACWLLLTLSVRANVEDVRERVAQESQRYRAEHPEFRAAPKHDFSSLPGVQKAGLPKMEVPGGVGFGFYFDDASLRWTNSTILDYYIITPSTMGGDLNYYLYLTSTCRAQLGTEALVSYYAHNLAGFWVFDWSLPNNQWQVGITLPGSHPEYLTMRVDEYANPRPMCHVRNGAFYTGFSAGQYGWENRVWLFNFSRGDWDLVYTHSYTTASLTSNLFVSNANHGYWGPIVEVFLSNGTYDNLNPAGFDLTRLFQDGNPASIWLSTANSYSLGSAPFRVLTETSDRGFVAYTGVAPSNRFKIADVVVNPSINQTLIAIDTVPGRDYQLYAAPTPSGIWATVGPAVPGDGTRMQLETFANPSAAFFRVASYYDTGSLYVIANTNAAAFSLSPARGVIATGWVAQPDGRHWDRTVVGLPPGSYTVNFDSVPGLPPLPSQTISVIKSGISPVMANYSLPAL